MSKEKAVTRLNELKEILDQTINEIEKVCNEEKISFQYPMKRWSDRWDEGQFYDEGLAFYPGVRETYGEPEEEDYEVYEQPASWTWMASSLEC